MVAGPDLTGRLVVGLHAESDALELVGLGVSISDLGQASSEPTRLLQDLPDDTLAALAGSEMGDRAVTAWEELESSGALEQAGDPFAALGLDFPEDLRAILGNDLVVAAFGDVQGWGVGARVRTDDRDRAQQALDGVLDSPELRLPQPAVFSVAKGGYVVASDYDSLRALGTDGGLGGTDAFRAAVADPAEEASKFEAVEALGFSAGEKGDRFTLRITTR